jgi:phosphate transport system permease protein
MKQTIINPVYRKRLLRHRIGIALSVGAMLVGLFFLLWILSTLLIKGFGALSLDLFLVDTPAPGSAGGLRNAILGSLMIVGLATFISTPIGVLAGVYLAEYGEENRFAQVTRFVTDIMLSAPSIVLGMFVWAMYVDVAKHYSGYAGSIALSLIAVPVVVRTTDNMLRLVPSSLLEAAFALGAPRWKVATLVRLKAVRAGVITGVLLAVARITGETAPLLYTALNNQFMSTDMNAPLANLPVVILQFAMSPYDDWRALAWAGALLLTFSVLLLNILARTMFSQKTPN